MFYLFKKKMYWKTTHYYNHLKLLKEKPRDKSGNLFLFLALYMNGFELI